MSITINGNGTVTGLSAGGLPAGSVTSATLADGAAAGSKLGAGSIIQVVHVTKNDISSITTGSSSANYDVPGLTATITPSSTSNKILIDACLNISINNGYHVTARILRGSTYIAFGDGTQSSVIEGYAHRYTRATNGSYSIDQMTLFHEDSPSTTSATTYKIQFNTHVAGTAYINRTTSDNNNDFEPRSISGITVMEILD